MLLNPSELIKLDCSVNTVQTIQVSQYDRNSRNIQVKLFNEGEELTIPNTATVRMKMLKSDGHFILNDCEVENNIINVPIDEQMTIVAGKQTVEILVINYGNSEVLYSTNFYLFVKEGVYSSTHVESTDEFHSLEEALLEVDSFDGRITALEEAIGTVAHLSWATDEDIINMFD